MRLQLKTRTEYNFRRAYGAIDIVADTLKAKGTTSAAITDTGSWGHIAFTQECKRVGIKPIFGAEFAVVEDVTLRHKFKQPINYMTVLAKTQAGLSELYNLIAMSTDESQYYYHPRLSYKQIAELSDEVYVLSGINPIYNLLTPRRNILAECSFISDPKIIKWASENKIRLIPAGDNYFPRPENRAAFEVLMSRARFQRVTPMHIVDEWEMRYYCPWIPEVAFKNLSGIEKEFNAVLPVAENVKFPSKITLRNLCLKLAAERGVDLKKKAYKDRLDRELNMIAEKQFEDYFFVLWDMLTYAKQHMFVGPARGSSCGSLVCYILSITEIDTIPFNLLFERFIDTTRKDLPDVDIDFADDKREMVFEYLRQKYGEECVARLGTILRYKAKSAIGDAAEELDIPQWEVNDLKNSIIDRSGGDARAKFCILDTFQELDIGKATIAKYPELKICADLEYHAHHHGQHAAGIIITAKPLSNYCSVDRQNGAVQLDKNDAEKINLLKIDALGLRTLSILQDCIDQIGWSRKKLFRHNLDDEKAFAVLNESRFTGVFQFEGFALQSLVKQMGIREFNDIVAITALARPGPLASGAAADFVERRTGKQAVEYLHDLCIPQTEETYGTIVYQEQVMEIGRVVGKLSWEDVSSLRKAMSKSLGKEFFDKYWNKFVAGAKEQGMPEETARHIWDNINTMGSWAFNKSHAVAYGVVSYWCALLKAHYPLQFAAACLRNAKSDEQSIKLLRELHKEGFKYKAFDKDKSDINWTLADGKLVGGFLGVKGCGKKTAEEIVRRRAAGEKLLPKHIKIMEQPITPWDDIFECKTRFGKMKENPADYNIKSEIIDIETIGDTEDREVCFFGKLKEKNLRDKNEQIFLAKRDGRRIDYNNLWLNFKVEDDTSNIMCTVQASDFEKIGRPILETMNVDQDWLLIRGFVKKGFRKVYVDRYRHLNRKSQEEIENGKDKERAAKPKRVVRAEASGEGV